jgi:membrane-associated phospholipid phosphatase
MKFNIQVLFMFLMAISSPAFSQQNDSLVHKLDSLSKKTDSAGKQINNISPLAYNDSTRLTFTSYFTLLASDLKQAFTKPFHMEHKDWLRFGKFALLSGGLLLADEPVQQYVVRTRNNNEWVGRISNKVTTFGGLAEIYTLSGFGLYGIIFKKEKMLTTTLLATQAYITGSALENVLKLISGRTRPNTYFNGLEAEPKFLGPFSKTGTDINGKKVYSSFPSGHTTVVFAAATVFAKEYHDKPFIPIIAYSVATLVGLSRVAENAHWTTDIVAGAALGYLSGRLIVNNYHRYAKIKAPSQNKNTVSFNLQYERGMLIPGIIYKFK